MTVQAGIDERVRELVGQHRAELAQLVDAAVERELAALVEQRIAANGNGLSYKQVGNAATKRCTGPCGLEKPAQEFERYRSRCKACRRADARQAARRKAAEQQPAADPEPRPAAISADELARRADVGHGALNANMLTRWLLEQRFAVRVGDRLAPTARTLEVAGPLT